MIKFRAMTMQDVAYIQGQPQLYPVNGITATIDGRLVGAGGYVNVNGRLLALFYADKRKVKPITIHRMTVKGIRHIRSSELFAACDERLDMGGKWLRRLGFQPIDQSFHEWCKAAGASVLTAEAVENRMWRIDLAALRG